jgi:phage shock protein PspC (stress-responsive transcriptional regulator)
MTSTPPPAGPQSGSQSGSPFGSQSGPEGGHPAGPDTPTDPTIGHTPPGHQDYQDHQDHQGYQADYGRPGAPRVTADQVRDLGRLRRIVAHRKVAGVAGGIARHLDIDPLIVRVAFVVLSLFGGAGLIVYAACWILLPEDGQLDSPLGLDERSRSIALILVGILGVALLVGQWDWFWVPGPLILIGLVVWLVVSRRNESRLAAPVAPPPGVPGAGPAAVTPEQRWAAPAAPAQASAPTYDVPVEQQPSSDHAAYQPPAYATYQQPADHQAAPDTGQQAVQPPSPPYATHYVRPEPRNPRKRGPKLFWFTMALSMLAVGVVGIIDVSGAPVAGSTYPAVVTGVIGLMLLVGAFYGRAGGLILVGLLTAAATAVGLAVEKVDGERVVHRPTTSSAVLDTYSFDVGEHVLDLTRVVDPEELDGDTIEMTGDVGEIQVIVPDDMDVVVDARIDGPGGYTLFGQESGGIDTTYDQSFDGDSEVATLTLDLQLDVGHIEVRTEPFQENR